MFISSMTVTDFPMLGELYTFFQYLSIKQVPSNMCKAQFFICKIHPNAKPRGEKEIEGS